MRFNLGRVASIAIGRTLRDVLHAALSRDDGRAISKSLEEDVRIHVQDKYPGSQHWSPSKVNAGFSVGMPGHCMGQVGIDIAGAGRAYHDVTIVPVKAHALAIPIHSSAYGKKPADIEGLFKPKNKSILAKVVNGQLVPMFALARRAFQHQDTSLMPSDDTLSRNIGSRWISRLIHIAEHEVR